MIRTITFAALSAAVLFGAASGAMAATKKGKEAYASAAGGYVDPRDVYHAGRKGGGDQTWCDADSSCNGWDQYLKDLSSGKAK
jgi:hypothetical protein